MPDGYPTIRAAAVQAASVFLDRDATVEKTCELIGEAAENGAQLVAFPEGFVPAHPLWFHYHVAGSSFASNMGVRLFKNSLEVPGPEIDRIGAAARAAGTVVVLGVCERLPGSLGTLYNTQVFIGADGKLLAKHQKLMPTGTERLVHALGSAATFGVVRTSLGPLSGLICGENSNPLAVFALTAEGTQVHVMSWPSHLAVRGQPMASRATAAAQAFAQMSKVHVVSACGTMDDSTIRTLDVPDEYQDFLRAEGSCGGSAIVSPDARIIAGPMGSAEGIIYADLDIDASIRAKMRADIAGHYNRPDVFHLSVGNSNGALYSRSELPRGSAGPTGTSSSPPEGTTSGAATTEQPGAAIACEGET